MPDRGGVSTNRANSAMTTNPRINSLIFSHGHRDAHNRNRTRARWLSSHRADRAPAPASAVRVQARLGSRDNELTN